MTDEPPARLAEAPALLRRPDGPAAARILDAALAAVDPASLVRRAVTLDKDRITLGDAHVHLRDGGAVWCIAVGKAAPVMARALAQRLGSRLRGGIVVAKHPAPAGPLDLRVGAHPVPDERSVAAGRAVVDMATAAGPDDLVIVLLSGGASSLMVAPRPGLPVTELHALGRALVHSGASIEQINAVRARLDDLKGGGLARLAAPATVATLVLDDVVDAPLYVVGSGPTLPWPQPGDALDARVILRRHGITASPAVLELLSDPPPPAPVASGPVVRLAGNDTAVAAALDAARASGWDTRRLPPLRGEARAWGQQLALLLAASSLPRPTAFIAGGETTVTVRGDGRGGRNQELALAAMFGLDGLAHRLVVTLATDGEDGPTDAAGAVVDADSLARAQRAGLDPAARLRNNDAYAVFDRLEDLLRIGPTATNVCDLVLALARP